VGHHGSHGTTAAAMVHCVLSSYVSFVRELYVKYTFPPNKIFYCSRAKNPTRSLANNFFWVERGLPYQHWRVLLINLRGGSLAWLGRWLEVGGCH